jgi:hypothetical protein
MLAEQKRKKRKKQTGPSACCERQRRTLAWKTGGERIREQGIARMVGECGKTKSSREAYEYERAQR